LTALLACAEVAKLHDALEQLEPVSEKHGITAAAGMTNLIKQHKVVQQQIAAAKHRAATSLQCYSTRACFAAACVTYTLQLRLCMH